MVATHRFSGKPADDPPDKPDGPAAALGEPFATYARLLLAADDAKQRLHAASIDGCPADRSRLDVEAERAVEAVHTFKAHHGQAWVMFARWAGEVFGPGTVLVALGLPGDLVERVEVVE